jgi:UDP-N-acetylmuramate--alanine ligase
MKDTCLREMNDVGGGGVTTLRPGMHVHLVGVGGAGMSAIAWVLLGKGFVVSGSDLQRNAQVESLEEAGAAVFVGHHGNQIDGAELVVVSSAVPEDNVEIRAARERGVSVWKRARLIGELMKESMGIAVAGTHGKTTTTSMIAHILLESGADPSYIVGGVQPDTGRSGRAGAGDSFVVEADEYDHMFLGLWPRIAVITNVEHDHPDLFETPETYRQAFRQFVDRLESGGVLVVCRDDDGVRDLLATVERDDIRVLRYGLTEVEDDGFQALDARANQLGGSDFIVVRGQETLGVARVPIPGQHNVQNALAAIAVCDQLDIPFTDTLRALISFGGVGRRFQLVGEIGDVAVIDDYAHHPTEIRVTLTAARQRFHGRRLWAVWQPHTYSRTRLLKEAFANSFEEADRVIVLDVYQSRETDTLGVSAAQIVAQMVHPYVRHIASRKDAAAYVLDRIMPGDVLLTLGAGDGDAVGAWVLEGLKQRRQPESTGGL